MKLSTSLFIGYPFVYESEDINFDNTLRAGFGFVNKIVLRNM